MPVVKSFTQAQWDAAARRLDALPEKPAHEHRVNVRDGMKCMQPQVIGAQRKGYTQEEIVQQIVYAGEATRQNAYRYGITARKEGQSGDVVTCRPCPRRITAERGWGSNQAETHTGTGLPRISDQAGYRKLVEV
jgi:hypothetical protein